MPLVKSYKDLDVYKKAFDISIKVHVSTKDFPREELYGITSQIRRSSKSICANIAEGFEKQKTSKTEFKRFLVIALGSCQETRVWIEYCHELGYIDKDTAQKWDNSYEEIKRMLNALHAKS